MKRFDIINHFIKKYNYKSYLEIGTQLDRCIVEVKCEHKTGVDPSPEHRIEESCDWFYELTSDEFFATNKYGYDIIFVDGLHHSNQVIEDINNALLVLNEGGTIIVHDCNPLSELSQRVPMPHVEDWNGDVLKRGFTSENTTI